MPTWILVICIIVFGLTLWAGLYLISRDHKNPRLDFAGLGTVLFVLSLGSAIIDSQFSPLPILHITLTVPALGLISLAAFLSIRAASQPSLATAPRRLKNTFLFTLVLFLLSAIALLLPLNRAVDNGLFLLANGALFVHCLALAFLDAANQGEALLPDLLRSFDYSCCIALLFGGQVAVVMLLATGPTLPMLILLLAIIATSISIEVFLDAITTQLDRLAFSAFPRLLKERAELRTTASTLPRINPQLDILRIDEQEFIHYTRRALSNFGDLARLATSPLIHLPAVASRVTHNGNQKDALSQAIELKAILMESIERLKPRNQGDFGTSDEWRYYNALYFPYIAGIKPYSRRSQHTRLDSPAQEALQWFRTHVPERTLYNWQNAASRLIAQDLRQACMQDQT